MHGGHGERGLALYQKGSALPRGPLRSVSSCVRSESWRADRVGFGGHERGRVSQSDGVWLSLEVEGVVANFHGVEGDGSGRVRELPSGCRLYGV